MLLKEANEILGCTIILSIYVYSNSFSRKKDIDSAVRYEKNSVKKKRIEVKL